MTQFWDDFPAIEYDIERVQACILESVRSRNATVTEALTDLAGRNGKLLRPGFVVLGARMRGDYELPNASSTDRSASAPPDAEADSSGLKNGSRRATVASEIQTKSRMPADGPLPEKIYRVAAAIELLHLATLIHDDIIDEAKARRGYPTIHSEYGTKQAVLMGDFLFSRCYRILADNATVENARRLAVVVSQIVTGEIDQSVQSVRGAESLSTPRTYLRRVVGKTATLIADSLYLGASEAGIGLAQTLLLRKVGYSIGMAFQIIDDILDFTGRAERLGKAPGSDLKQGIVTLPVIYAMRSATGEEINSRIHYPEELTDADLEEVIGAVERCGGFSMARQKAELYTRRALRQISIFPRGPNRETLAGVTRKLLDREY